MLSDGEYNLLTYLLTLILVGLKNLEYDQWEKWEAKWTHIGLSFQTGVKTSSVQMMFHFGCISKRPDILMDMRRHFILGSVHILSPKMKLHFCQNDSNGITPAMSFKCTCTLNTISNEPALIHFASGKSHAGLKFHFGQNDQYEIHTGLSFIPSKFMWTQVKNWLNTRVRFSTEMKSHAGLRSFRLSCERTLKFCIFSANIRQHESK